MTSPVPSRCPKCGVHIRPGSPPDTCPVCGVLFSKVRNLREQVKPPPHGTTLHAPSKPAPPTPAWVSRLATRLKWADSAPKLVAWGLLMIVGGSISVSELSGWERDGGRISLNVLVGGLYDLGGKVLVLGFFLAAAAAFFLAAYYTHRAKPKGNAR